MWDLGLPAMEAAGGSRHISPRRALRAAQRQGSGQPRRGPHPYPRPPWHSVPAAAGRPVPRTWARKAAQRPDPGTRGRAQPGWRTRSRSATRSTTASRPAGARARSRAGLRGPGCCAPWDQAGLGLSALPCPLPDQILHGPQRLTQDVFHPHCCEATPCPPPPARGSCRVVEPRAQGQGNKLARLPPCFPTAGAVQAGWDHSSAAAQAPGAGALSCVA